MKISVIVPVYNSEIYLKRCIESVEKQIYQNWELILVDDGSQDDSSKIIDQASIRDNRIIAIHQKNLGPGLARNRGIEEASGDYVVFLDSDDYIDENYFKLLVPKAEKSDIVFIDIMQVTPDDKLLKEEKMSKYKFFSKDKIIRYQMTGKIPWGGVRKAVKLKLLKENNIGFTSHDIGEEALYSLKILNIAENINFLDEKPVYFYVNHENSQSKIRLSDPWGPVVQVIYNYIKNKGLYETYGDTLNSFNITATVISLDKITQIYKGQERKYQAQKRISQLNKLYDIRKKIDYSSMSYKAKVFSPFLIHGFYFPVIWCSKLKSWL